MSSQNPTVIPDFVSGSTYMFDFSNNQNTISGNFGLKMEIVDDNRNKIDSFKMDFSIQDAEKCIS